MKAAPARASLLRLLALALLCGHPAFPAGRARADFPIRLSPERTRYLLGEPVYLRMRGEDAVPLSLEGNTVALVIRDPDGGEHVYRPPLRFRTPVSAGPGPEGEGGPAKAGVPRAARLRYARLIAEGEGWAFPRAGRYVLRLRAPSAAGAGGVSLERPPLSDTVSLEIAAPSDSADRRAFALISRAPSEYALAVYLEGGDQFREGMAVLRELASFPNAYARAAGFVLCSDWAQDYWDRRGGGGAARRLDLGKALSYARWDKGEGPYLALRTAYRIRAAIALAAERDPADPALGPARARLSAFEDSLTASERVWLASF